LTVASDLRDRLTSGDTVEKLASAFASAKQDCEAAAKSVPDALQAWSDGLKQDITSDLAETMSNRLSALSGEFDDTIGNASELLGTGAVTVGDTFRSTVESFGERLSAGLQGRLESAISSVVEAAGARAISEVAETTLTAQLGATVTAALGPYLPVAIAIKPALPAIQDALDALRGGL
jgi:hypothetical protein